MSPSSRDPAIPEHLAELERELSHARGALLEFAEAEGLLPGLVAGENTDPQRLHPDVESARREATVDELLWLVGEAAHSVEGLGDDGPHPLYAALLALAEAFDILIDQFSLVYGDAVALAQAMWPEWHAMSGCHGHQATPEEAAAALERVRVHAEALPQLLTEAERLPSGERALVEQIAGSWSSGTLAREARHLARHALDTWMPRGIEEPAVAAALARGSGARAADPFQLAIADLLLGCVCHGTCRDPLVEALELPFAVTSEDAFPTR